MLQKKIYRGHELKNHREAFVVSLTLRFVFNAAVSKLNLQCVCSF